MSVSNITYPSQPNVFTVTVFPSHLPRRAAVARAAEPPTGTAAAAAAAAQLSGGGRTSLYSSRSEAYKVSAGVFFTDYSTLRFAREFEFAILRVLGSCGFLFNVAESTARVVTRRTQCHLWASLRIC